MKLVCCISAKGLQKHKNHRNNWNKHNPRVSIMDYSALAPYSNLGDNGQQTETNQKQVAPKSY